MPTRRNFVFSAAAATAAAAAGTDSARAGSPAPRQAPSPALPPSIAALTDRAHEATPITLAERQARADKARRLLSAQRLSALCITGGTSLTYFTGMHSGQSERLVAWVLPTHAAPFIVCPSFEEGRIRESLADLPDGALTRIFTWQEDEDPYLLVTRNIPAGPLALDERVQFVFADALAKADPHRTVVSGIPIVSACRMIKSPAELALMHLANDITLSVYRAAYLTGAPGLTNRQFTDLIAQGYARSGVQGEASCQVGEYSALPHGSRQPQIIREGQVVLLDDGCFVEGYQSDISRSFVYGKPTDKQRHVFDTVHRAQSAALAAARPGVACEAIDAAARKVITDAGFGPAYRTFTHRVGHGIGMDMHEWPYLVRGNTLPLAAGMCFSDEPGIYLPGPAGSPDAFGIRLEDDWHLTDSGGVFFTPQSPSLEHPFA